MELPPLTVGGDEPSVGEGEGVGGKILGFWNRDANEPNKLSF